MVWLNLRGRREGKGGRGERRKKRGVEWGGGEGFTGCSRAPARLSLLLGRFEA